MHRLAEVLGLAVLLAVLLTSCGVRGVAVSELRERNGITYRAGSETPFSGMAIAFHDDGSLRARVPYEKGKKNGMAVYWDVHGNKSEVLYKNGQAQGVGVSRARPIGG